VCVCVCVCVWADGGLRATGFCGVIFGWDIHDRVYTKSTYSTAENGVGESESMRESSTQRECVCV
jgi:hypothetical protein